jgi:hypothetical protein
MAKAPDLLDKAKAAASDKTPLLAFDDLLRLLHEPEPDLPVLVNHLR